jgi:hypothetical protein
MKGIAEAMLLLLFVGGLVAFLAMQVLGVGIHQPTRIGEAPVQPTPTLADVPGSYDASPAFQHSAEAPGSSFEGQWAELRQQQEELDNERTQLEAEKAALAAERTTLDEEQERLYELQEALAFDRAQLEENRKALVSEQAQLEEAWQGLEDEAVRLKTLEDELRAERLAVDAEWFRVRQEAQRLRQLERDLYILAAGLGAVTGLLGVVSAPRVIRAWQRKKRSVKRGARARPSSGTPQRGQLAAHPATGRRTRMAEVEQNVGAVAHSGCPHPRSETVPAAGGDGHGVIPSGYGVTVKSESPSGADSGEPLALQATRRSGIARLPRPDAGQAGTQTRFDMPSGA